MNWETLLCLGDSITIGARSYLAYPEYAGAHLADQTGKHWNVINHAVSGYTTVDLLRSVDAEFAHLQHHRPEVVSIMIGTNDLKKETSLADFRIAYQQLLVKARLLANSSHVITWAIPKLQPGVMLPYRLSMNDHAVQLNAVIRELTGAMGMMHASMDLSPADFYDGVHLNGVGSQRWGIQLAEQILNLRHSS